MNTRWKRWVAGVAGLAAVYAGVGFWLVPRVLQHQLPQVGEAKLERRLSAGAVAFNPFTLKLDLADLRLAEADGTPLLAVDRLAVGLQWRSVLKRAWSFDEIRITAPAAHLAIAPDGRFNVAELLATLERHTEPDADAGMPRLAIASLVLERGRVDLDDRQAGYTDAFAPIDFTLTGFSTLPDGTDAHTLTARTADGGLLRWRGEGSLAPIRGSGELVLENVSLPQPAVYLKRHTLARVAGGKLSAKLPYRYAYADGKLDAHLAGASLALRELALLREGASDAFATLSRLDVNDVSADLVAREATVGELRADGGKLVVRRDAKGLLDLAQLVPAGTAPPPAEPAKAADPAPWKLAVRQVLFDDLAVDARDETVTPALALTTSKLRLRMQVAAEQAGPQLQVKLSDVAFSLADLAVASGAQVPLKLAALGFEGGQLDLAGRRAEVGRIYADGGQLQVARDAQGGIGLLKMVPRFESTPAPAKPEPQQAWTANAGAVELSRFSADVQDAGSGIAVRLQDIGIQLAGAGTDLRKPVKFDARLALREGGKLAAQGSVVPATGAMQADVDLQQLALAPLQPLLEKHVRLHLAAGDVSARGRVTANSGKPAAALRYMGRFDVAGLVLNEEDGQLFAGWKNVGAERLVASVGPNRLDIPELRVTQANAKLIIEDDRSFNAARLLVKQPAASPAPTTASTKEPVEFFPVRIGRVRLDDAKLDFADLSLRPQFAAKIHALNGVVDGLASEPGARSQVALEGRVDEFGLARIRGALDPFVPRNETDLNVVFRNVDMVSASPYSMKFAGYRIAEGKISLDLRYKVRDSQLQGSNQVVIDKLTLGERIDSPDAIKLPLELAIAILKDSEGRIDLGLPVTGNLDDPQFSYGAVVWKAIANLLARIVTAPFRALGGLAGADAEKLETVDFDAGRPRLLPPEREKLLQVAQLLAKRPQLKLAVPGHYSEEADGAALRRRLVRAEIARRADREVPAGEEPAPLDMNSRKVRAAVRELYAARFGDAELDRMKQQAEAAVPAGAAASEPARAALPMWQRVGKMVQGEPQVADAAAFYRQLLQRLDREQALPKEALAQLGTQRAEAIVAALREAGVDAARAVAKGPEAGAVSAGQRGAVGVKLELGAR